jgi:hypothetical protein
MWHIQKFYYRMMTLARQCQPQRSASGYWDRAGRLSLGQVFERKSGTSRATHKTEVSLEAWHITRRETSNMAVPVQPDVPDDRIKEHMRRQS